MLRQFWTSRTDQNRYQLLKPSYMHAKIHAWHKVSQPKHPFPTCIAALPPAAPKAHTGATRRGSSCNGGALCGNIEYQCTSSSANMTEAARLGCASQYARATPMLAIASAAVAGASPRSASKQGST